MGIILHPVSTRPPSILFFCFWVLLWKTDKERARQLLWPARLRIALGAARGLEYMHRGATPPVIHRDIKTTNILLDDTLEAKVADFGLSRLAEQGSLEQRMNFTHVTTGVKGTPGEEAGWEWSGGREGWMDG